MGTSPPAGHAAGRDTHLGAPPAYRQVVRVKLLTTPCRCIKLSTTVVETAIDDSVRVGHPDNLSAPTARHTQALDSSGHRTAWRAIQCPAEFLALAVHYGTRGIADENTTALSRRSFHSRNLAMIPGECAPDHRIPTALAVWRNCPGRTLRTRVRTDHRNYRKIYCIAHTEPPVRYHRKISYHPYGHRESSAILAMHNKFSIV